MLRRFAVLLLALAACRSQSPKGPSVVAVGTAKAIAPAGGDPCSADNAEAATTEDAVGRKVAALCIEGASIGARDAIEKAIHLGRGATLDEAALRRTLEEVHKAGVADDVAIFGRKLGPGVVVIIRIHERARVGKVELEGATIVNVKVEQAPHRTPLHPGEYYDPAYAYERAEALREKYASEGFDDTTVTPKITKAGEGVVDVHMVIVEGKRTMLGKVTFKGITRSLEPDLLKASRLVRGEPITQDAMGEAPLFMSAFYYDRGYVTVNIQMERGPKEADGTMPVTFNVTEGSVFRVGKIGLLKSDLDAAATKALLARLKTQPGGVFRRAVVMADIALVKQAYADRGRKVNIEPQTELDQKKKTLDLNLAIEDEH